MTRTIYLLLGKPCGMPVVERGQSSPPDGVPRHPFKVLLVRVEHQTAHPVPARGRAL